MSIITTLGRSCRERTRKPPRHIAKRRAVKSGRLATTEKEDCRVRISAGRQATPKKPLRAVRTEADGKDIRRVNLSANHSPKVICGGWATEHGKTAALDEMRSDERGKSAALKMKHGAPIQKCRAENWRLRKTRQNCRARSS